MSDTLPHPDSHHRHGGTLVEPLLTLNGPELDGLSSLFKLLSDKTRLSILQILSAGECNVTCLCKALTLPQPTVSHHLGLLRMSRLIDNRRDGKQVFYRLNGRISAAGISDRHLLKLTRGSSEVVRDVDGDGVEDDPAGMQILGRGFTVQILTAPDIDPVEGASQV